MSPNRVAWVLAIAISGAASPRAYAESTAGSPAAYGPPTDDPAPFSEGPTPPLASDWAERVARLELGYRGTFVASSGYDPFSTDGYFPAVSLVASRTVFAAGPWAFAPGIAWDYGRSAATARGDSTSLKMQRVTVPLEGRLHFGRWGYLFARIAPGAAMERAEVDDPSAPSALTKSLWLFTGDASAGYALPVLPLPERPGRAIRVWLQGDFGYSWTPDNALTLTSNSSQTTDAVALGSLGMRGAFLRFAVALSY
ncbi:MAG TPA: hypothetical protein VEK07_20335 [Polyangiaceae bacterium]|nr:hypothetical protein [Polyangiaceae bacterium]